MILVVSLYEGLSIVEAYCGLSTTTSTTSPTVVSEYLEGWVGSAGMSLQIEQGHHGATCKLTHL